MPEFRVRPIQISGEKHAFNSFASRLIILEDEDTGVQYIASDIRDKGISYITPRLNNDGTLYISHVNVKGDKK